MKPCFVGIDIGTNAVKGLVTDRQGTIMAEASAPVGLMTPRPGWVEQYPELWWEATLSVLEQLTVDHNCDIQGVSVSGQMHSLVVLDAQGEVVRPSILWSDQRTAREAAELTQQYGGEEAVIKRFGNPVLAGFTAPKLLWLRHNEPEQFARIARLCLPKDYITWRLTGVLCTDPSDASGTLMYRVRDGEWDQRACAVLGVEVSMLPELRPSGSLVGPVSCPELPHLAGVPVVVGGADNAASAYGCGVEKPGDAMISLGSSGTVVAMSGDGAPDMTGRVHLFQHVVPNSYYHMAVILSATNSLDWYRERFAGKMSFGRIEELVGGSPVGSNGVIFLPYLNGERTPHRDSDARGVLFGLSSFNGQGDVLRAIHEGVAFAMREGTECIRDLGTPMNNVRIVGGGSRSRTWCQMLADNLGLEIWSPLVDEGAAYGSARLAAQAVGADTSSWVKLAESYRPDAWKGQQYALWYEEYRQLYRSVKDRYARVATLLERGK
jgi:xylulokinase